MQTHYKELSDTQWQFIEQILNDQRKRKHHFRFVVDAILEVLRTGTQWRNLGHPLVPWQSVFYYFRKWKADGTLERPNAALNQWERKMRGKPATPSLLCIDGQSVKAAALVGRGTGIDGNKPINGRKGHIIVGTLGLAWGVVVHAADIPDGPKGHPLVGRCPGYLHRMKKILVGHAYKTTFGDWVNDNITGLDVGFAARPPPAGRGFVPVKWRWVDGRTFAWPNFFRRHAKDCEKTPQSTEAWVLWANCQIVLNHF
jgi:transposase